mgnify:CR=1 FL=1
MLSQRVRSWGCATGATEDILELCARALQNHICLQCIRSLTGSTPQAFPMSSHIELINTIVFTMNPQHVLLNTTSFSNRFADLVPQNHSFYNELAPCVCQNHSFYNEFATRLAPGRAKYHFPMELCAGDFWYYAREASKGCNLPWFFFQYYARPAREYGLPTTPARDYMMSIWK